MRVRRTGTLILTPIAILTVINISQGGVSKPQSVPDQDAVGIWVAAAEAPDRPAPPVVFRMIRDLDGALKGFLESPDQIHRTVADEATFAQGVLRFRVGPMGGSFEGTIGTDGMTLKGTWSQAGQSFPLLLKRAGELPRANRPQEPKRPYPYDEEEIVYENKEAGIKLAGTLTLPHTKGPFPAVRLIGGSGALNRDDDASGHRTFLVLADHLARRGLAVLRVDKRGVWKSTGDFSKATTKDFADDARAGVAYLRSRKDIDPERIGLIGHSEGAMIAQMLAAQSPDVRFIVLMAGPGTPLDEILVTQNCLYAKADGAGEEKIALLRDWYERFYAIAIGRKENTVAEKEIQDMYAKLSEQQRQMLDWSQEKLNREIEKVLSPWSRYLLSFDPKPFLMKVRCPVLAICGEKDLQVAPTENLRGIAEALKAGGNEHYTVKALPSLNHLFQTAETGAESEYSGIEETMAPIALETMADWIIEQATSRP